MRPKDRQGKIIDLVRQSGEISVGQLARHFGASQETIRRDLHTLSSHGAIQRIHGGATLVGILEEGPFRQRMLENVHAKRQIAKQAIKLVEPGRTVFIDTGSTTVYFAEEIAAIEHLTIITNSLEIAKITGAQRNTSRVFLTGGEFNPDNQQTHGEFTVHQAGMFRACFAILTVGAIDCFGGIMDYNPDEAEVARAMIRASEKVIVLADSSKFNRIAAHKVCGLEQIDILVSEARPDRKLARALEQENVLIQFPD